MQINSFKICHCIWNDSAGQRRLWGGQKKIKRIVNLTNKQKKFIITIMRIKCTYFIKYT